MFSLRSLSGATLLALLASNTLAHPTTAHLLAADTLAAGLEGREIAAAKKTPNATIDYYAGGNDTSACVTMGFANGSLAPDTCASWGVQGIRIHHVPTRNCTLTMFANDANCGAGATQTVYKLGADNGTTCAATGVLDGGKWYHGSGIFSCK